MREKEEENGGKESGKVREGMIKTKRREIEPGDRNKNREIKKLHVRGLGRPLCSRSFCYVRKEEKRRQERKKRNKGRERAFGLLLED